MKGLSPLWRVRWLWTVVLLVGLTPLSEAADENHTFIVDAKAPVSEDQDADYRFHSLSAVFDPQAFPRIQHNDTVLIRPGEYDGSITVNVPGVLLKATGALDQTVIHGQIALAAKHVRLDGLTIDGSGQPNGLFVTGPHIELENLVVYGATEAGVFLEGADFARVENLSAHNNGASGLLAVGVDDLHIEGSRFQANARHGLEGRDLGDLSINNSRFTLNQTDGFYLERTRQAQVSKATVEANGQHGGWFEAGEHNTLANNTFSGNGGVGLVLNGSVAFDVDDNAFTDNGGNDPLSGGVLLRGNSQGHRIQDNEIRGHSDPQAAGIRLLGSASANLIVGNALVLNQVGIALQSDEALGQPQANTLQANHVERSHGAGISSSGRNNLYQDNVLSANNGPGAALDHSDGEVFDNNSFADNTKAGLYAKHSSRLKLLGNRLIENLNGVLAEDLSQSEFEDNTLQENQEKGLRVLRGEALKVLGNRFLSNGEDGVWLENTRQASVNGNRFKDQLEIGLQLEHTENTEVYDNVFEGNRGGLTVWGGQTIAVQFNDFLQQAEFGLWAMDEQGLDARYNYWGAPQGPTGIAPSDASGNDVVKEVSREALFPWLPQSASSVVQPSVKGWYFDKSPGEALIHAPRAGVSFELSDLNATPGWLIVHTPTAVDAAIPPLDGALFYFWTHTGGQLSGTLNLSINLSDRQIDETLVRHELRLMRWDGQAWQALPGVYTPQSDTLNTEVAVDLLGASLFALALPAAADDSASTWIAPQDRWIVGEALLLQLSDPDRNQDAAQKDRLEDAVQVTEVETGKSFAVSLNETAPNSGLFALEWPNALDMQGMLTLHYQDPNVANDHCQVSLQVLQRQPFVVDATPQAKDNDFVFSNLPEAFSGTPSVHAGETIYIKPGDYAGRWQIDVPGVQVQAEPGAVLKGQLVLAAEGIGVSGLTVDAQRGTAIEVSGAGVSLTHVTAISHKGQALEVTGDRFSLQAGKLEGTTASLRLSGNGAKISDNAIIGAPQLLGDALSVERNWWGNAYGPWKNAQEDPQEGVFPWLLSPPVDAFESVHVEGTTWYHPGVWQVLGALGNALLTQHYADAWELIKQLFGQGGNHITVAPGWSLRVNATGHGRLIVQRQADGATQQVALWVGASSKQPPLPLRLVFVGPHKPSAQWRSPTGWVALKATRAAKGQWQIVLPRLLPNAPAPLWLQLSEG